MRFISARGVYATLPTFTSIVEARPFQQEGMLPILFIPENHLFFMPTLNPKKTGRFRRIRVGVHSQILRWRGKDWATRRKGQIFSLPDSKLKRAVRANINREALELYGKTPKGARAKKWLDENSETINSINKQLRKLSFWVRNNERNKRYEKDMPKNARKITELSAKLDLLMHDQRQMRTAIVDELSPFVERVGIPRCVEWTLNQMGIHPSDKRDSWYGQILKGIKDYTLSREYFSRSNIPEYEKRAVEETQVTKLSKVFGSKSLARQFWIAYHENFNELVMAVQESD